MNDVIESILTMFAWAWSGVLYITGEWYQDNHLCKHEEKKGMKRTCIRFLHHPGKHRYH